MDDLRVQTPKSIKITIPIILTLEAFIYCNAKYSDLSLVGSVCDGELQMVEQIERGKFFEA